MASASMSIDWPKPSPSSSSIGLLLACSGGLAEEHHLAHHAFGLIGADVRELLSPHVADVVGERRDHQREAFGDAAGMNARAVQRDAALRQACSMRAVLGPCGGKNQPMGVTTFTPASRIRVTSEGSAKQRAVEHAVGSEGQQRIDVPGGAHTGRIDAADLTRVLSVFGCAVHPDPGELELGMGEDAFDRQAADVAGRPLNHAIAIGPPAPRGSSRLIGAR